MDAPRTNLIRFGVYEIDVRAGELRKHGTRIRLQEQPFQVLLSLLERPGEVVTREQLREYVWPKGTFVDFDHGLNTAIKKIRQALSDDACVPRYVETIPRRGYRFLGAVQKVTVEESEREKIFSRASENVARVPGKIRPRVLMAGSAALALIALLAGYAAWHASRTHGLGKANITVVVLPFENLSGDANQKYLSDGVSEELTMQLGVMDSHAVAVIDRWTAASYQSPPKRLADIGRELHADYVVEGSVRRQANRVRVTAQLVRTSDQGRIWADEFDRDLGDVLAFQSEVAGQIVKEVKPSLLPVPGDSSR